MSDINVLSWQNENTLRNYPLPTDVGLAGVIIDASFVQFDGFTPVLQYIDVSADSMVIAVQFDTGEQQAVVQRSALATSAGRSPRFYETVAGERIRYLGCLVLGDGAYDLFKNYVGRKLEIAAPFLSSLSRSIPSRNAVYSFNKLYGAVKVSRTATDSSIFYNINTEQNSLTFNAISNHRYEPSKAVDVLRQLNLVKPLANNVFISSNDVIKVVASGSGALDISLITANSLTQNAVPSTLAS